MSNCAVYNDHIILVTTTYYESIDEMRFHLAVETMRRCRYYGYRLVIIDGSPDESVATTLRWVIGVFVRGCTFTIDHSLGKKEPWFLNKIMLVWVLHADKLSSKHPK
jgi:hypothetical protein